VVSCVVVSITSIHVENKTIRRDYTSFQNITSSSAGRTTSVCRSAAD